MRDMILRDLDALLEDERAALIAGDLDRITELTDRKAVLMSELAELQFEAGPLLPLQRKLRRNQALLDGALEGVRAVASRIATLRGADSALETYDRNGRRQTWSAPRKDGLERRA